MPRGMRERFHALCRASSFAPRMTPTAPRLAAKRSALVRRFEGATAPSAVPRPLPPTALVSSPFIEKTRASQNIAQETEMRRAFATFSGFQRYGPAQPQAA